MSGVTFEQPWLLALLALPVLALLLTVAGHVRAVSAGRRLARRRPSAGSLTWPAVLAVALGAAIVSAAQPRWGSETSAVPRKGAELVIVLDISRSMDARDVSPSRLEAAKRAIIDTLDRLGGNRAGLVVFAGSADLRFPLTSDLTAARQVVATLETGQFIVTAGTNAATGLDIALSAFDFSRPAGRVVLLLTDGDNLGGDPAPALLALRGAGVSLLVAGVGTTEGTTVPFFDRARRQEIPKPDAEGQPIVSQLDQLFLQAIAAGGGGRYLGTDLAAIPGQVQATLSSRQQAIVDERAATFPVDRYHWFAGGAVALIILATVAERLRSAVLRRTALAAGVAAQALFLAGCATDGYTLNEDGRKAFAAGDYPRAIELFTEASAEQPGNGQVLLNLARSYAAAGMHEEARQSARRVLLSRDDSLRAEAHAVIGHQEFAMQRMPESLDAFRQALVLAPGDADVRHNYEVVLRILTPPERGNGEPGDGEPGDGQPGDGQPGGEPGDGQPGEGEPGTEPGDGEPGAPPGQSADGGIGVRPNPNDVVAALVEIDSQIADLMQEAGDRPTAAEANEILALIAERQRLSAIREALNTNTDPRDY